MKMEQIMIGEEHVTSLQEIYCNTVLETEGGNQLAVCMRDDTLEISVVGFGFWYRVNMQNGTIKGILGEGGKSGECCGDGECGKCHNCLANK